MKKLMIILLSLLFVWWLCHADLAWYSIQSYTSEYDLQKDGTLKVKEIIDVNFYETRHGIYRNIPYKYSNNLSTPIKNVKVLWDKFTTSKDWNNFQIKIGDKNKTIFWEHEYIMEYDIKKTIRTFSWQQELYWNLLWLEWNTPVNNFYFELQLPDDVKISEDDFYVVYWPKWSQTKLNAHIEGNSIVIDYPMNIWANQAVTIWIKFPPNTFKWSFIDRISNFIGWISEWFYNTKFWKIIKPFISLIKWILNFIITILVAILVIFSLFASNIKIVLEPKHLRMKRKNLRDVIHYTPPKWYSPIEINLLYNRYPSTQIITTALYTRVAEWYIKTYANKTAFWFKNILFETIKEKEDFWKNERAGFRSDLEEELRNCIKNVNFNKHSYYLNTDNIKDIANRMFISLRHELIPSIYKKYTNIKQTEIPLWFITFWAIIWLMIFVYCKDNYTSIDSKFVAYGFFLLRNIIWSSIYYWLYYYRWWIEHIRNDDESHLTDKWKEILEQIYWFRKFLLYVEDERLNKLLKEDPEYCEKMLPYAIALWVWNKWIKKCRNFSDKFNIETIPSEITTSHWSFTESIMSSWVISNIEITSSDWWWDWWSDSWFDSWWSSSWSSGWWGWGGWWWSW